MNDLLADVQKAFQDRVDANDALRELDLHSLTLPSIRLVTERIGDAELPLGASRIGGSPDLPADAVWPTWTPPKDSIDACGEPITVPRALPLGFIAQIDLSEIPPFSPSLPHRGWLWFFYELATQCWGFDPADRGCCRVIYLDCERETLQRRAAPQELHEDFVSRACSVQTTLELTLPDDLPSLDDARDPSEAYWAFRDQLGEGTSSPRHRLLGHPDSIQGTMELECQLASNGVYVGGPEGYQTAEAKRLEAGAADWQLLLQIDTDEDGPGWMWGDVGTIYFWIRKQDLLAREFGNVWLVFQCC